jgi:DNA-binding response OmpR family regulator
MNDSAACIFHRISVQFCTNPRKPPDFAGKFMLSPRPNKILLVEDEDSLRLSLEIKLNMTNQYIVTSCASGEDAIDRLQGDKYDVILLDFKLPGLSGLDVLKWMQEQKILTPVILLSGYDDGDVPLEAMRHGAYDYIRKAHMDYEGLTIAIESVFERFLYRSQLMRREKTELEERQRMQELDTLRTFQNSVTSIGQFAESGLNGLMHTLEVNYNFLKAHEHASDRERFLTTLQDLKRDVELVMSGVRSMVDLSSLVAQKLSGIDHPSNEAS